MVVDFFKTGMFREENERQGSVEKHHLMLIRMELSTILNMRGAAVVPEGFVQPVLFWKNLLLFKKCLVGGT